MLTFASVHSLPPVLRVKQAAPHGWTHGHGVLKVAMQQSKAGLAAQRPPSCTQPPFSWKHFIIKFFSSKHCLQITALLEVTALHVLCVTCAALCFSVTDRLCSPLQKYRPMSNPDQGQRQAHVQPLGLSLQSSASTTLYLMELHKSEEKRFSSKIGE